MEYVEQAFIPCDVGKSFKTKAGEDRVKVTGWSRIKDEWVGGVIFLDKDREADFNRAYRKDVEGVASVVIERELDKRSDGSVTSYIKAFKPGPTYHLTPAKR